MFQQVPSLLPFLTPWQNFFLAGTEMPPLRGCPHPISPGAQHMSPGRASRGGRVHPAGVGTAVRPLPYREQDGMSTPALKYLSTPLFPALRATKLLHLCSEWWQGLHHHGFLPAPHHVTWRHSSWSIASPSILASPSHGPAGNVPPPPPMSPPSQGLDRCPRVRPPQTGESAKVSMPLSLLTHVGPCKGLCFS